MKTKLSHILIVLMVMAIMLVSGCIDDETAPTGDDRIVEFDRTVELISIRDLLENREKYDGVEVAIKGTIINQCSRGCKFNINDGTGVMFVEMIGEAWEKPIPPSIGKIVEVRGTFYQAPRPQVIVVKVGDVIVR